MKVGKITAKRLVEKKAAVAKNVSPTASYMRPYSAK
jgi:hypothetical protein